MAQFKRVPGLPALTQEQEKELCDTLGHFFTPDKMAAYEKEMEAKRHLFPPGGTVAEHYPPCTSPVEDPGELLEHRFLCRGSTILIVGPTGVGKSSLITQMGFSFSAGIECLGFRPAKRFRGIGMRVLIVQAENDRIDTLEMIEGIRAGCPELQTHNLAAHQIHIFNLRAATGMRFAQAVNYLVEEFGPFDIVIVDPVLAYLGSEAKGQKEVGYFLRELLDPLAQKHNFGLIICHHTNKPANGREKPDWQAGDFAYLGSGSAEWANFARGIVALRNVGSSEVFELMVPKRGQRLRWNDGDGNTIKIFVRHAREPGKICWEKASKEDIESLETKKEERKGGRPKSSPEVAEVLRCIDAKPGLSRKAYTDMFRTVQGASEKSLDRLFLQSIDKGWLRFRESGKFKHYAVTEGGRDFAKTVPAVVDWVQHWQNLEKANETASGTPL